MNLIKAACLTFMVGATADVCAQSNYDEALQDWSKVLSAFVGDQGRVDFYALADARADLDRFVAYIGSISPASRPDLFPTQEAVLAYHINAYNALAMHGVIEAGIPVGFGNFFKRAAFFKFRKVVIGGETTSLYDYENDIIRPIGEPRVHFALNCMVRSCPRLPRDPYRAGRLNTQLENATREFFASDRHIRIDRGARTVWLSEILDFYPEDFSVRRRTEDLIPYVNQYLDMPVDERFNVRFIPYDWTLNLP